MWQSAAPALERPSTWGADGVIVKHGDSPEGRIIRNLSL